MAQSGKTVIEPTSDRRWHDPIVTEEAEEAERSEGKVAKSDFAHDWQ